MEGYQMKSCSYEGYLVNSRYSANVQPIGNNGEMNQYATIRRVAPDPDDPYPEPIGDISLVGILIFIFFYLMFRKKMRGI